MLFLDVLLYSYVGEWLIQAVFVMLTIRFYPLNKIMTWLVLNGYIFTYDMVLKQIMVQLFI